MVERERHYAVVVEPAGSNYSVYVPDLPGCISTGRSIDEAMENIRAAINLHLDGMRKDGVPTPEPSTWTTMVTVDSCDHP